MLHLCLSSIYMLDCLNHFGLCLWFCGFTKVHTICWRIALVLIANGDSQWQNVGIFVNWHEIRTDLLTSREHPQCLFTGYAIVIVLLSTDQVRRSRIICVYPIPRVSKTWWADPDSTWTWRLLSSAGVSLSLATGYAMDNPWMIIWKQGRFLGLFSCMLEKDPKFGIWNEWEWLIINVGLAR